MKLSGSYQINLSKQKVWEALNDPEILKKSIPGCEEFKKNSKTEFTATATNKIGPFNASFTGDIVFISGEFIRFESVTLVPYEPKLIDFSLMNPSQIDWFNQYNKNVLKAVIPRLKSVDDAKTIALITERTTYVDPWINFKKEL